jgi:bifunctional non-homologous end joining protein LigD
MIREHHARRLHFELRMEIGGIVRSWIIPNGPSMNPNDKRLAIATIENYGSGKIPIWDKGELEVTLDVERFLEKGWLVFTLRGRKLRGQFMLERWSSNYFNWSLYKLTDEYADVDFELEPVRETNYIPEHLPLFEGLMCQ